MSRISTRDLLAEAAFGARQQALHIAAMAQQQHDCERDGVKQENRLLELRAHQEDQPKNRHGKADQDAKRDITRAGDD